MSDKSFRVIFTYHEPTRKWEATVEGAESPLDALQGFNAVVLTAQMLDPDLLTHGLSEPGTQPGVYKITPAVR